MKGAVVASCRRGAQASIDDYDQPMHRPHGSPVSKALRSHPATSIMQLSISEGAQRVMRDARSVMQRRAPRAKGVFSLLARALQP